MVDNVSRNRRVSATASQTFDRAFAIADKVFKLVSWALTIVAVQVVAKRTGTLWLEWFAACIQFFWIAIFQMSIYAIVEKILKPIMADNMLASFVEFMLASIVAVGLGISIYLTIPDLVSAALPK